MSEVLVDRITAVLRRDGWTCEYHEPVSAHGQCSQCDDAHRRTAGRVAEALNLTEEWGVQISYGSTVISNNPLERPLAEAVVHRNHTGNAHLASRLISGWTAVEPKPAEEKPCG